MDYTSLGSCKWLISPEKHRNPPPLPAGGKPRESALLLHEVVSKERSKDETKISWLVNQTSLPRVSI